MPELEVNEPTIQLADLLVLAGVESKSQAKRLAKQGGIKIDDEKHTDPFEEINVKNISILRIGKRKFYKIKQ